MYYEACKLQNTVVTVLNVSEPGVPKLYKKYGSGLVTRFAFSLSQICQEPRNDSDCQTNIREFLKGCTAFRVEVSVSVLNLLSDCPGYHAKITIVTNLIYLTLHLTKLRA